MVTKLVKILFKTIDPSLIASKLILKMHILMMLVLLFTICGETVSKVIPLDQELSSTDGSETVKYQTYKTQKNFDYIENEIDINNIRNENNLFWRIFWIR